MKDMFDITIKAGQSEDDFYSPEFARDLAFGMSPQGQKTDTMENVESAIEPMAALEAELAQRKQQKYAEDAYNLLKMMGRVT